MVARSQVLGSEAASYRPAKEIVAAIEGLKEIAGSRPRNDRAVETDRLNASAAGKFKQTLPVTKDNDCDFERHVREFRQFSIAIRSAEGAPALTTS